jgi:hypothetical protein
LRTAILIGLVCVSAGIMGCDSPAKNPAADTSAQKPKAPTVPEDIFAAASGALSSEVEVLAWGDLALTGKQQILAINRLNKTDANIGTGAVFTRLAILESDGKQWKEILLCAEHIKNPNGFLGGTPTAAVSQWRLQFEKNPSKGLLLFLTPFNQGPNVRTQAIEVRWNPEVKRYQAMDANYETFTGENPALEDIHRELIR